MTSNTNLLSKSFRLTLLSLPLAFISKGCLIENGPSLKNKEIVEGYIPVYGDATQAEIIWLEPRTVRNPGKIYSYGEFLLINEVKQGIHVYDNHDPSSPTPIGFVQLLGNTDMAIKDNILYADHMGNLVSLSTGDFSSLGKIGTIPLRNWNKGLPPPSGSYFECIDTKKGFVVGWKKVQLKTPDCYAF